MPKYAYTNSHKIHIYQEALKHYSFWGGGGGGGALKYFPKKIGVLRKFIFSWGEGHEKLREFSKFPTPPINNERYVPR